MLQNKMNNHLSPQIIEYKKKDHMIEQKMSWMSIVMYSLVFNCYL
jgi:hypothetical protein